MEVPHSERQDGMLVRGAGRTWLLAGIWLGVISLAGCSGPSGPVTVNVSGTVTLDGEPVPNGEVMLLDPARQSPTYAGKITNGKFSFRTTPGRKQVSVTSPKEEEGQQGAVGGIEGDPVGPENPAIVITERIPERYNEKTELEIEVLPSGSNTIPLDLTTK